MKNENKMIQKLIKQALLQNTDLTEEEYNAKILEADKATAGHGITKKAAVKESVRAKRIQMNFYGIILNYIASILGEMASLSAQIAKQNVMIYAIAKEQGINVDELFKRSNE